jgi:hypothetical protein
MHRLFWNYQGDSRSNDFLILRRTTMQAMIHTGEFRRLARI